jgi:hypothetical protein
MLRATSRTTARDPVGVERTVPGILSPYSGVLAVWSGIGEVERGINVGPVGMANTYAVLLDAPPGEPDRFLWVQEQLVTNLMAHQPILANSVFDARGKYLGKGGSDLDRSSTREPLPLMSLLPPPRQKTRSEMPEKETTQQTVGMTRSVLPVRPGIALELLLPEDLTAAEAERLANMVRLLPFEGT